MCLLCHMYQHCKCGGVLRVKKWRAQVVMRPTSLSERDFRPLPRPLPATTGAPCHPIRRVRTIPQINVTSPNANFLLRFPCTLSDCCGPAAPSGGSLSCVAPHMWQCLGVGACSTDVNSKRRYFCTQSNGVTHVHFFKLQIAIGKRL